ncbi:MAG: hypothetical protein AAGA86_11260 [Bacteroidota bacterium]
MWTKIAKIKAFTVQEMVVVLLITSMVVGMAFSVLGLVQKQMGGIATVYRAKSEADRLRKALWIDFNRYTDIQWDAQKEYLHLGNELETKLYDLSGDRPVSETDTFYIPLKSKKCYFGTRDVISGQVDALELQMGPALGERALFVYKENTADTYLNQ